MSVDSLLREQGERLRDEVRGSLDVQRSWDRLTAARRRRRQTAGVVAASAVAASVVGVVALVGGGPFAVDRESPPVDAPTGAPTTPGAAHGCVDSEVVQCLGDGMMRVRNGVTYRFVVPSGFDPEAAVGVDTQITDVYRKQLRAGVSVLLGVRPADPGVRDLDARGLATWLASRPYLDAAGVTRERLDGRAAWSVRLAVVDDLWGARMWDLEDACNDVQPSCRPLLRSPDGRETGHWVGMTSRYWFMDVPGEGVAAVWSWTFEDAPRAMRRNEELIRTLVLESAG